MLLAVTGIYFVAVTDRQTCLLVISQILAFCFALPCISFGGFLSIILCFISKLGTIIFLTIPVCLSRDVQYCSAMCSACSPAVTHLSLLSPCTTHTHTHTCRYYLDIFIQSCIYSTRHSILIKWNI